MNFNDIMKNKINEEELLLKKYYLAETGYQSAVIEAMQYSFYSGGKRLRPLIIREVGKLFQADLNNTEPFEAAIEMIHTYSLVHDDLPAMDNDDYRRGKKTNHIVYGEDIAILAGDGLLNRAYELIADHMVNTIEGDMLPRFCRAFQVLSKKAGVFGMVGGQTADILFEGRSEQSNRELLEFIHLNKTGALLEAAFMLGGILGNASLSEIESLEMTGRHLGLAFQIQDDILDLTGDFDKLGKLIGSDTKNEKTTFITLNGLDKAKIEVEQQMKCALDLLVTFPGDKEFLKQLFRFLIHRET